jgi:pentatricopeptide repeat protein
MHWACLWTRRTLGRPNISYFSTTPLRKKASTRISNERRQRLSPRANWDSGRPAANEPEPEQQQNIDRFKRRLQRTFLSTHSERERTRLWLAYQDLRQGGTKLLSSVSRKGWETLWKSQASFRPGDPTRLQNLEILVSDMKSKNMDVTRHAEILRIEMNASMGAVEEAKQEWINGPSQRQHSMDHTTQSGMNLIRAETTLLASQDVFEAQLAYMDFDKEWLELGARLHTMLGEDQRLSSIVKRLGQDLTKLDPRVAVSMIESLNRSGTDHQVEQAWNIFNVVLRTPEFFVPFREMSTICSSFLGARNLPYATSVLCLMAEKCDNSETQLQHIFVDLYGAFLSKTKTLEEVDNVSLELLTFLPDGPVSGQFFDKWLTQSAQAGDKEHTSEIIELMFEKGRAPQARHIDKLLDVWIRSAGPEKSEKAESLALSMIKKQLDSTVGISTYPGSKEDHPPMQLKKFLKRPIPGADTRTYVLLMSHYAKLGDIDAAKQTLRLMTHSSNLRLNSQMTRAILAIHFTMGDVRGAWQFFQLIRSDSAFQCDMRTAAVLWKGVNLHLAINKTQNLEGYPGPRYLFEVMLNDLFERHEHMDLPVSERPHETMYERIIHCFCLAEDTPGVILALHSLKAIFNQNPSHKTVLSVMNHIAHRHAWKLDADDRPASFADNVEQQTAKSAEVVKAIWTRMQEVEPSKRLFSYPGVFERKRPSLKGKRRDIKEAKGEEVLLLLTQFVRFYLLQDRDLGKRFGNAIDKAKVEMGLTNYPEVDAKLTELRSLGA